MRKLTPGLKIAGSLLVLLFGQARLAWACHDGSPLVLDLNGDGIQTTDVHEPVRFDIDGDGTPEEIAWTRPDSEEGFLWLDLNRNRRVDGGRELFGDGTLLPHGEQASHGFEALAVYDERDYGGNGDGAISPYDLVWEDLRVWVDRDHDGFSDPAEVRGLTALGILEIGLAFQEGSGMDGNANLHRLEADFLRRQVVRGTRPELKILAIEDVFFRIKHTDH